MFVLSILVLVPLASADNIESLTIQDPDLTGAVGTTLSFSGTVTTFSDGLGPVYLNDYSAGTTPASPLVIDGTPFLLNFPSSISGAVTITDTLFTVFLPTGFTPGVYDGYFSILGGANPSSKNLLANYDWTVTATAPSAVPEPSTYVLMATGLGALILAGCVRRRSTLDDAA